MAELLEELLCRCRNGDRQAMATLMERYWQHAKDQASAILNDEQLAEDAAQETMVIVLLKLDDLRKPAAFAGWLRQIARSQATRLLRRRGASSQESVCEQAAPDGAPADSQHAELMRLVRRTVASLPDSSREPVRMYYLAEVPQQEIARALGVPEGTIKRRLHDARKRLRDMLLGYITDGSLPPGLQDDEPMTL